MNDNKYSDWMKDFGVEPSGSEGNTSSESIQSPQPKYVDMTGNSVEGTSVQSLETSVQNVKPVVQPVQNTEPVVLVEPVVQPVQPVQSVQPQSNVGLNRNINSENEKSNNNKIVAIILAIIVLTALFFIVKSFTSKGDDITEYDETNSTLVEDVAVSDYVCLSSNCTISIKYSDNEITKYEIKVKNIELLKSLDKYENDVKLNIYYINKEDKKVLVNYKLYLKSTGEDISGVKDENELREKLGLYTLGEHTDTFTYFKQSSPIIGIDGDNNNIYIFIDDKGDDYHMRYSGVLDLQLGDTYEVTFEVVEGSMEYEYFIKSVNKKSV